MWFAVAGWWAGKVGNQRETNWPIKCYCNFSCQDQKGFREFWLLPRSWSSWLSGLLLAKIRVFKLSYIQQLPWKSWLYASPGELHKIWFRWSGGRSFREHQHFHWLGGFFAAWHICLSVWRHNEIVSFVPPHDWNRLQLFGRRATL